MRDDTSIPEKNTVFLDTETTGLAEAENEILEIAIVDYDGNILLDTLVKPEKRKQWPRAQKIHGIRPKDVTHSPTLTELLPKINDIIHGKRLVIYNAPFDTWFFPDKLEQAGVVLCAMREYTKVRGNKQWSKLLFAAQEAKHIWNGPEHRALPDTLACRSVWLHTRDGSTGL